MQTFILTLLMCSLTMSLLALIYIAATPLLERRYSARGRYYAWLIIIIGLIIPFRPSFDNAVVKVEVTNRNEVSAPVIQVANGTVFNMREPITVENTVAPQAFSSPKLYWWQITAAIWLLGLIVFLVYYSTRHYRFVRLATRWSEIITDQKLLSTYENAKKEMGIDRQIQLMLCKSIGSPMMIGFINPKILIPKEDFEPSELQLILKHELIHYKRKDLWYKLLVLIANAMHWFNPVAYLITKNINLLCEISCDDAVVQNMDNDARQLYSKTIIGAVKHKSKLMTSLSTNFYGGKNGIRKRILSIMTTRSKRIGLAVICAALVFTIGTAFVLSKTTNTTTVWDNFPKYMEKNNFLTRGIVNSFPSFSKEVKEEGTTLYSWNTDNRNEDSSNIYLSITDNIMTTYHCALYSFNTPRLDQPLSLDDASIMVSSFAEKFIPHAEYLTFENKPYPFEVYVQGRVETWVAEYSGLGEYAVAVDVEIGGVVYYSFIPSEFAGMTKAISPDGTIDSVVWGEEMYLPFMTVTDASLFKQFSFVNGNVDDIIFGIDGYSLRDYIINFDEAKSNYILFKPERVTEIPQELIDKAIHQEEILTTEPVSYTENELNSSITYLTLDNSGTNDDSFQLIEHIPDGAIYAEKVDVVVTLGDGRVLTKSYEGFLFSSIAHANLLRNGQQQIILGLYIFGSTYSAMNCHVLGVVDGELVEILTILDGGASELDAYKYEQTLYEIFVQEENSALGEYDRTEVCSGVSIVDYNGSSALRFTHLMKEDIPYSIVMWDGTAWTVVEQGIEVVPVILRDSLEAECEFFTEYDADNIIKITDTDIIEVYSEKSFGDYNVLFYKAADLNTYAGVQTSSGIYRLRLIDTMNPPVYANSYEILSFDGILGSSGFKINASMGAAYDMTAYYRIDDGAPIYLAEANGVIEIDLDEDGDLELLSSSAGSMPPWCEIIKNFDGTVKRSSVGRDLLSDRGVTFNSDNKSFTVGWSEERIAEIGNSELTLEAEVIYYNGKLIVTPK